MSKKDAVSNAERYYDSKEADGFYSRIWGGQDIHIGIYESHDEPIRDASRRTVEAMARRVELSPGSRVLDLGAGYGGSARYLARTFGCHTTCLNLSEVQNERNRQLTRAEGLAGSIEVVRGNFEELPFPDATYSVVWSQDAMLHSGNRGAVVSEAARVLENGGVFVFTDPMQAEGADPAVLQPVLERIDLDTLGSPDAYRAAAEQCGLTVSSFADLTAHLVRHYSRVLEELEKSEGQAREISGDNYVERMKRGLEHWVAAGENGSLVWGIFVMRKG